MCAWRKCNEDKKCATNIIFFKLYAIIKVSIHKCLTMLSNFLISREKVIKYVLAHWTRRLSQNLKQLSTIKTPDVLKTN